MEQPFQPEHFRRVDENPDPDFYNFPRKVVHIDDAAIDAVKQFFTEILPPNSMVLDLLSSWRSHWPAELPKQALVGLGLNAEEMAENPHLDDHALLVGNHTQHAAALAPIAPGNHQDVVVLLDGSHR